MCRPTAATLISDYWLIAASYGGAAGIPAWYHNLAAAPDKARIEVNGDTIPVSAEQLHGARDASPIYAYRWMSCTVKRLYARGFLALAVIPERIVRRASSTGRPARSAASASAVTTASAESISAATSWPRLNAARLSA